MPITELNCANTPGGGDVIDKINELVSAYNLLEGLNFSVWQPLVVNGTGYSGTLEYRTNVYYTELRGVISYTGTDFMNKDVATLPVGVRPSSDKYDVGKRNFGFSGLIDPNVYNIQFVSATGIIRFPNGVVDGDEIRFNNVRFDRV